MEYLKIENGEWIIEQEKIKSDDIIITEENRNFLLAVNEELESIASTCRRELKRNRRKEKNIILITLLALTVITWTALLILSIPRGWGFFLPMAAAIGLLIFAFAVSTQIYFKKSINSSSRTLSDGKLYCAVSLRSNEYTFIADGKIINNIHHFELKELLDLTQKPYFIVAFDKKTGKSVSVRLFAD